MEVKEPECYTDCSEESEVQDEKEKEVEEVDYSSWKTIFGWLQVCFPLTKPAVSQTEAELVGWS